MFLAPFAATPLDLTVTIQDEAVEWRQEVKAASEIVWTNNSPLTVGTARYSLKREIPGRFHLGPEGMILAMDELAPQWMGIGSTPTAAEEDLKTKLHAEFQRLVGMRPFQMMSEDKTRWSILDSVIDVSAYRRETPLEVRELGSLAWYQHQPFWKGMVKVVWLDGREELIPFTKAPPHFAGLRPPAWIDAVVLRHPLSGEFIQMVSCHATQGVEPMSASEATKYVAGLPPAKAG